MTHDRTCTFDHNLCRDCKLQAKARESEREHIAYRISTMKVFKVNGIPMVEWDAILKLVKHV